MSIGKVIFQWFQQYLYCTSVVYVFVNWMNEKNEWLPTVLCFVFKIFVGHRKIHTLNSIYFFCFQKILTLSCPTWVGVKNVTWCYSSSFVFCRHSHRLQKFCVISTSALSGSLCTYTTWITPCPSNHPQNVIFGQTIEQKFRFALIWFVSCLTQLTKANIAW